MHEPLHLSGADQMVPGRITELRTTACEVRGVRRDPPDHQGLVARTRGTLGRRLISLGATVAGQEAWRPIR